MTQIVSFSTTKGATDFKDLTGAVKTGVSGLQSQSLGTGVEEPQARRWVLQWDSETKSDTPDVESILKPFTSETIDNVTVEFSGENLNKCLSAPVTEMIFATTKPGQDLITFGEIVNVSLTATDSQPGCLGSAWGYTKEKPGVAVLVVGWENVDYHKKFSRTEVFNITSLPFRQGVSAAKMTHYTFQHE